MTLINPRMWLELAIVALVAWCGWYGYNWIYDRGAQHTQIAWDKEKAEITAAALKASEAARLKEKSLNLSVERVSRDYQQLKADNALLTADLGRVQHNFQTALDSRCAANPSAPNCLDGAGRLNRELLEICAGNLVGLGQEAQRLREKVIGLQDYIKAVK